MLRFLSTPTPRTQTAHQNPVAYDAGASSIEFLPSTHKNLMRVTFPTSPTSIILPPLHWHHSQAERFDVLSGLMGAHLNGTDTTVSAGNSIFIPCRALHRFWNAGKEGESCTVDITLDPSMNDEKFFRNFYGYVDDARDNGGPSLWQMLLFLHAGGVVLAVPGLPRVLGDPLGKLIGWVGGVVVGKWALGMEESYGDYYKESAD